MEALGLGERKGAALLRAISKAKRTGAGERLLTMQPEPLSISVARYRLALPSS